MTLFRYAGWEPETSRCGPIGPTPCDIERIRRLAAEGKTFDQIGRLIGYSKSSVYAFAARHGIATARKRRDGLQKANLQIHAQPGEFLVTCRGRAVADRPKTELIGVDQIRSRSA